MFGQRKDINEVFTPRNSIVNTRMYIERDVIEKALYRSVSGSMHSFLFGESGTGKSWMYKKVLADKNIKFVIANCANASRTKSLTNEIFSVITSAKGYTKTGYTETKKAGVSLGVNAEVEHEDTYEIIQTDKLLAAFKELSEKSKNMKSIIVLDNVETIIKNESLMNELADIIILLDDNRYAEYQVKFLIVGVPNQVIQLFSSTKNPTSIGNRIEEIPRVAGLQYEQVLEIVKRGFIDSLCVVLSDANKEILSKHIFNITLGVPQRIHEYCETLAYLIEDNNWEYDNNLLDKADHQWLLKGLRESYTIIDGYFNSKSTTTIRRNQVIFALGKLATHQFDTNGIANCIGNIFPNNSPDSNSGIGQILASLSKGTTPMLKKHTHSSYTIIDPRYLMCIRLMLYIPPNTYQVKKKDFRF